MIYQPFINIPTIFVLGKPRPVSTGLRPWSTGEAAAYRLIDWLDLIIPKGEILLPPTTCIITYNCTIAQSLNIVDVSALHQEMKPIRSPLTSMLTAATGSLQVVVYCFTLSHLRNHVFCKFCILRYTKYTACIFLHIYTNSLFTTEWHV